MPRGYTFDQVDRVVDKNRNRRRMSRGAQWKEIAERYGFEACREVDREVRARLLADPYYAEELAA